MSEIAGALFLKQPQHGPDGTAVSSPEQFLLHSPIRNKRVGLFFRISTALPYRKKAGKETAYLSGCNRTS